VLVLYLELVDEVCHLLIGDGLRVPCFCRSGVLDILQGDILVKLLLRSFARQRLIPL